MILDTSAIVAIVYREPEAAQFSQAIYDAEHSLISAASFVELLIVLESQAGPDASRQCDAFLRLVGAVIEPVTVEQAHIARQAFLDFGKGRHPAGLNFGDCFAYALAKVMREPLLCQGKDFAKTDLQVAVVT